MIRPLRDKIVFKLELEKTTQAGIIITAIEADERVLPGSVVAVGEGSIKNGARIPPSVKVGDRVLLDKFALKHEKVGDETIIMGTEDAIFGVLENMEN